MRGEVLHYDEAQGFGFIHGADGNRYTFVAEDLRRQMPMEKGAVVEFQPNGDKARAIFTIRAAAADDAAPATPWQPGPPPMEPAAAAPTAPPHFGRLAVADAVRPRSTGLWAYFRRGLTENYATFRGRARRKEYWGYFLFWSVAALAICFIGLIVDGAAGNLDSSDGPLLTMAALGLFVLATLLPGVAITVRRIHDMGLSGWFYLLVFVPYIGALIVFVFTLLPSQRQENRWGSVPEGIRL
jgi:uncharacterized membrane protein YhaH (DUF805 family)/cold shock CspA family protein